MKNQRKDDYMEVSVANQERVLFLKNPKDVKQVADAEAKSFKLYDLTMEYERNVKNLIDKKEEGELMKI